MREIQGEVRRVEQKIRQEEYQESGDFMEDLERLKAEYSARCAKVDYIHKELVLRQICEKLICKGLQGII